MKFDFNRYIGLANPKVLSYHKQAETFEDYQDAYNFNPKRRRYAVADGVSNSIGAKLWAQLLVDKFCDSDVPSVVGDFRKSSGNAWLESIRLEWSNKMSPVQSEDERVLRRANGSTSPNHGAATFIGFEIREHQDGNLVWEAMIIGDTCLFHLGGNNELIDSYPLKESSQFTNQPKSFATLPQSNIDSQVAFLSPSIINQGDMFIIATDALAKWMLIQYELGNWVAMMQELDQISYQSEFYEFINKIRRSDKAPLEDDDVTLLFVPTNERPLARNYLSNQPAPVNDNYTYALATITFAHERGVQTKLTAKKAGGEDGLHRCTSEANDERKSNRQKPRTSGGEGQCQEPENRRKI